MGVVWMDVNAIVQIVTSLGFPIVCCGAMMYYVKYITDKNRDEVASLNADHKEEMLQIKDALNNNTMAIQRLCDKLDKEG